MPRWSKAEVSIIKDHLLNSGGSVVQYGDLAALVKLPYDGKAEPRAYWKLAQAVSRIRTQVGPEGYDIYAIRNQGYVCIKRPQKG